jgi:Rps23 Pro-64 3,4-dihydroxylase Tpa1-like proline 4-hydroxylase
MIEDYATENLTNIETHYLQEISKQNVLQFFGTWTNNIQTLRSQFLNALPFEHIVIDNFLETSYAEKLAELFPPVDNNWHEYKNPIEVKYAFDNIDALPIHLKNYFYYLSTPQIIQLISSITDITNLEYDKHLHGAGLHAHPRYGRLNIHLDYEKHPLSGKERRLNVILFISKDWDPSWNGANELWDQNITQCISKTDIKFNRAIIFKTNDISWHGLPDKIMCPQDTFRKSLAYYYVSPLNTLKNESNYRKKARFVKRPSDPYDENIQKLYDIRPHRRITQHDINTFIPNWTIYD